MNSVPNLKWILLILVMGIIFCGSAFGPTLNFWATWLTDVDTNNNESVENGPVSYSYKLFTVPPVAPKNRTVIK